MTFLKSSVSDKMCNRIITIVSFIVERRPLSVTIISDLMAKFVDKIRNTVVQSFPGITITQLNQLIKNKNAIINYV